MPNHCYLPALRPLLSLGLAIWSVACGVPTEPAPYRYTLSGEVRLANGSPVSGATIRVVVDDWPSCEIYTGDCNEAHTGSFGGAYSVTLWVPHSACGRTDVIVFAESAEGHFSGPNLPPPTCRRDGESVVANIVLR